MNAKDIISSISEDWFLTEPLVFDVLCTHKVEPNDEISTMFRTGKRRIEYNPSLVEKNADVAENALMTEIYRILLKHPYQRVPQEPNRVALKKSSDIAICESCYPYQAPKDLLSAGYYNLEKGLSYEEYYKHLKDICPNVQKMPKSDDVSESDKADFEASELWEEDDEMSEKIQGQIEKAAQSKQWGSIGGSFIEKILARKNIAMDYKRILAQFRSSIMSDTRTLTRLRPNRRYGYDYMGSHYKQNCRLLVAVDSSGSISRDDLQNFFSVINRFFKYGVKKIKVIVFDTEITQELDFKKAKNEINVKGRGGTDFQAAIDYYEGSGFDGMIVFTDGYAGKPQLVKKKRILWILNNQTAYNENRKWLEKLNGSQLTWIGKAA